MGALVRSKQQAVAAGRQFLTFTVAGETFSIAIASIKEVIEYRASTELPMMPGYTPHRTRCRPAPAARAYEAQPASAAMSVKLG